MGWLANHWLSEIRDRRKEVRGQLDALLESLDELRDDALQFHMGKEYDQPKADSVLMALRKIEGAALRAAIVEETTVAVGVKKIRQAITLENFEVAVFATQNYSDQIITKIQLAVEDFSGAFEAAYSRKYPNRFPYYSRR